MIPSFSGWNKVTSSTLNKEILPKSTRSRRHRVDGCNFVEPIGISFESEPNLIALRLECLNFIDSLCKKYLSVRVDEKSAVENITQCNNSSFGRTGGCTNCTSSCSRCSESSPSIVTDDSDWSPQNEDSHSYGWVEPEDDSDDFNVTESDQAYEFYQYTDSPVFEDNTFPMEGSTPNEEDIDVGVLLCPGDEIYYISNNDGALETRRGIVDEIQERGDGSCHLCIDSGDIVTNGDLVYKVRIFVCGGEEANSNKDVYVQNPNPSWNMLQDYALQIGFKRNDFYDWSFASSDCSSRDGPEQDSSEETDFSQSYAEFKNRLRTSDGVTCWSRQKRMRYFRKRNVFLSSVRESHNFPWLNVNSMKYYDTLHICNDLYRKMLSIGEVDYARCCKTGKPCLASIANKEQYDRVVKNTERKYAAAVERGVPTLNIQMPFDLYVGPAQTGYRPQTMQQILSKEEILKFEHEMKSLGVFVCEKCFENRIDKCDNNSANRNSICKRCKKMPDDNFWLTKKYHPVWYENDSDGKPILTDPKYHIPHELQCLTMAEKLLIRRYAPIIPSVHIKHGFFGSRGHCITFPQDISEICNELPQRKETVVTFIRYLGKKNSSAVYPKHMLVDRERVIIALKWLKTHNSCYKDITIRESNLDWMGDSKVVNMSEEGQVVDVEVSCRSAVAQDANEYVSTAHVSELDDDNYDDHDEDDDYLYMETVTQNEVRTIPTNDEAAPIKELVDVARKTNQLSKMMDFPPIDHDSPIS